MDHVTSWEEGSATPTTTTVAALLKRVGVGVRCRWGRHGYSKKGREDGKRELHDVDS